jgi:DHA1 family bicyclomycin/chloramphenicol resistance-like MFS transporter
VTHALARTTLPLAVVACTSMLAMDLFLPAVPTLQRALAVDVERAQATVAIFLADLAASQLLWTEALTGGARAGRCRSAPRFSS